MPPKKGIVTGVVTSAATAGGLLEQNKRRQINRAMEAAESPMERKKIALKALKASPVNQRNAAKRRK